MRGHFTIYSIEDTHLCELVFVLSSALFFFLPYHDCSMQKGGKKGINGSMISVSDLKYCFYYNKRRTIIIH